MSNMQKYKYQAMLVNKKELETKLSQVKREIKELSVELCSDQWGVKVDDVVTVCGASFKVTEVEPANFNEIDQKFDKPWLKGVGKTTNGEFGKVVKSLYDDWSKVVNDE